MAEAERVYREWDEVVYDDSQKVTADAEAAQLEAAEEAKAVSEDTSRVGRISSTNDHWLKEHCQSVAERRMVIARVAGDDGFRPSSPLVGNPNWVVRLDGRSPTYGRTGRTPEKRDG
jgi:hypothetical protein